MKQKWMFVIAILVLVLSACGLNPVEKLEEKASEQVAEKIKVMMVQGTLDMEGLSIEEFYSAIHESLTAAGFTYHDMMGGDSTAPDPTDPNFISMVTYTHEDGYQFVIGRYKRDCVEHSGDTGIKSTIMKWLRLRILLHPVHPPENWATGR